MILQLAIHFLMIVSDSISTQQYYYSGGRNQGDCGSRDEIDARRTSSRRVLVRQGLGLKA